MANEAWLLLWAALLLASLCGFVIKYRFGRNSANSNNHLVTIANNRDIEQHFSTVTFSQDPATNLKKIAGLFTLTKVLLLCVMTGQIALNVCTIYGHWLGRDATAVSTESFGTFLAWADMILLHYMVLNYWAAVGGFQGLRAGLAYLSNFSLVSFVRVLTPPEMLHLVKGSYTTAQSTLEFKGRYGGVSMCVMYAVMNSICVGALGVMGLLSILVKVRQVGFCTEIDPQDWDVMQWVKFMAFVNNMLGVWNKSAIELDRTKLAFFGGDDAEIQPDELNLFNRCMDQIFISLWQEDTPLTTFQKCVVACTFDSKDLQKLMVESAPTQAEIETDGMLP